ncbi:MOSC domain-containing protein YiiM [Neorhizobium galegae]|uniref:MOSC domain-containing protein n=1 Tax=Neorhizobium galegae TaxID=399 RepID=UPI001AE49DC4|nr:MOSC domain-containing protein [Neorhizobium galegae]MBP2548480.1 MOSC domain-containing protein YiiM [Neorhizobium galegae]
MKVSAICLGQAEKLPGKSYKTGINKHPVAAAVLIDETGLVGDRICNRKYHGGPDQAVYVEGSLTLDWWAEALGRPIEPGTFGENLVIDGLDNRDVAAGDRFCLSGGVVLEATSARIPCNTFSARMGDAAFAKRYMAAARPGIYCRVLKPGTASPEEDASHVAFTGEKVPIAEMMRTFGKRLTPQDRARYLSAPIHTKLRADLEKAGS